MENDIPKIKMKLQTLFDVGLGYITLGQNAVTLSGGEAQRIKLAKELSRKDTGKTLYILDEPTTGLHFEDTKMLLAVLNRLVDSGNTVIVIEHHMDVIKTADYVIDLGPEGGQRGGVECGAGRALVTGDDDGGDGDVIELRFSPTEVLRRKDFADYTDTELEQAQRLMSQLRLVGSPRRSLRALPVVPPTRWPRRWRRPR